jgi:DNA polymerase-3 subunit gamma/tau
MNETAERESYRVLARKYRPANFRELIGQEALVQTLTNAIESERLAHAFMLAGVRGVGKTTTARDDARARSTASERTAPAAPRPIPAASASTAARSRRTGTRT